MKQLSEAARRRRNRAADYLRKLRYAMKLRKAPSLHRNAARHADHKAFSRSDRNRLLDRHDMPRTGRQWRHLRKALQRAERGAI